MGTLQERPFAHLHVASAFSLRYGTAFPDALVRRAAEQGTDTLALTDRDGLYGAIKHVRACHERGVRPIAGVDLALGAGPPAAGGSAPPAAEGPFAAEGSFPGGGSFPSEGLFPAPGRRAVRRTPGEPARVVVLARTDGWASLCRLVTTAHGAGERGEPYVTPGMIAEHATGPDGGPRLTVLLGPRSGFGRAVAERRDDQARALLTAWRAVLPDLVVEVSDLYGYRDANVAARMIGLADSMGVPVVLTNAVRYLDAADHQVGNVLDAARKLVSLDGRHIDDPTAHAYLKDGAEMARVAARICGGDPGRAGRLLAETRRVAERCVLDPVEIVPMLEPERPRLHLPEVGEDPVPLLRRRCEEGLARRGLDRSAEARDRLAAELGIIERKRLSGYFTAVVGITDMIRAMGVRCAIRGSGAGSLVNYLIGVGEVNPLEHGLLMERFLSEGRPGLPDIDLDVESARRLDCYRAILGRYGEDRVACVSMMETYRARSAIRDVGAAMGLPPHEIDVIAKAFPQVRARQIRAALSDLPELRDSGLNDRSLQAVFRLAERLDGLPRHIALHPCGVLIGNSTLRDRTPVERSLLEFPMSQFDKDDVEDAGLLKLDVLGVRMQSALAYALQEVERVEGRRIDLEAVPRDDRDTYDMIRLSRTIGCFQIESPGQRELVAKLEPRTMHDLIVDISLFRPGPVNSDMVTPYLETRHGFREARYPHESLREALRETNGVVVFHEQVMKVIDVMTGAGLAEADRARRALGTPEGREAVRAWFVPLARERGYAPDVVERAWRVLDAFGGFGFCKAHAAAFALPTYQSAWLKRHHTAAFLAGVLTHDPGMYPSRVILDEARQCGVDVLPLDVNHSGKTWLVERTGPVEDGPGGFGRGYGLRVPFSAVRGVSEAEVDRMVAGRPYTSLADFWERARPSRPVAERIVEVGGFDALHGLRPGEPRWRPGRLTRRDLIAQVGALDRGAAGAAGQLPMGFTERVAPGELPEMTEAEAVEAELAILGMDVSHHVMDFYHDLLDALGVTRSADLLRQRNGAEILVAGVKVATQTPAVRSGQRVIFTTLDDSTGPIDLTFFESVQAHTAATVFGSWLLAARGVVRRTGIRAVSLRAVHCWNLADLDHVWRTRGLDAVRAVLGEVPVPGAGVGGRPIEYGNGFRVSPYSDNGAPPAAREGRLPGHPGEPQRRLWHASSGSSGPPPGR
ncbi:DNA polymerase III subunit alpha [Microbispora sp. H10885]|uniref:DNA polymerase III subunit alpha n=1 Tax=Microbispora sp. H10885 TaxID=2729110 RepID=UPI0015FF2DFF|nr:DNA polymerase III subunit alpha [Microbispora sp. H10885]